MVVGFCTNLQLSCSVVLSRSGGGGGGLAAIGCESLFDSTIGAAPLACAMRARWYSTWPRHATNVPIVSYSATLPDTSTWRNAVLRGSGQCLEVVGAVQSQATAAGPCAPAVIMTPSPFARAEPLRPDSPEEGAGVAALVLRAARVAAVYTLACGQGCALYMCVHEDQSSSPPSRGERLFEYLSRTRSAGVVIGATLVFCMIDCESYEIWKFCGIETKTLFELFANMYIDGATFAAVADPERTDISRVSVGLACVLPVLHMHVRQDFREAIVAACSCDGDEDRRRQRLTVYPLRVAEESPRPDSSLPPSSSPPGFAGGGGGEGGGGGGGRSGSAEIRVSA